MVAIGFRGLQGPQVLREQRAKKVTLALQVQQGRSAQQGQQVPRDPLDLLGLGGLRDLLEVLEIHQPHPGASNARGPYAPSRERARFSSEILARAVHQPLDLTLGEVGNPGGSPEATRRQVNKAFLQDMSKAWDKHGMKSFASRTQAQLQQMLKDQRPKRDLEMIELGIVFVLSVVMLIAVVVTMWIVGIKV